MRRRRRHEGRSPTSARAYESSSPTVTPIAAVTAYVASGMSDGPGPKERRQRSTPARGAPAASAARPSAPPRATRSFPARCARRSVTRPRPIERPERRHLHRERGVRRRRAPALRARPLLRAASAPSRRARASRRRRSTVTRRRASPAACVGTSKTTRWSRRAFRSSAFDETSDELRRVECPAPRTASRAFSSASAGESDAPASSSGKPLEKPVTRPSRASTTTHHRCRSRSRAKRTCQTGPGRTPVAHVAQRRGIPPCARSHRSAFRSQPYGNQPRARLRRVLERRQRRAALGHREVARRVVPRRLHEGARRREGVLARDAHVGVEPAARQDRPHEEEDDDRDGRRRGDVRDRERLRRDDGRRLAARAGPRGRRRAHLAVRQPLLRRRTRPASARGLPPRRAAAAALPAASAPDTAKYVFVDRTRMSDV